MELGKMDTSRKNEPTYLAWSIFNTFCCCFPLGVAAIIYSCRADTANSLGDAGKAQDSSRVAKNLNIAAVVLGLIGLIMLIVMVYLDIQGCESNGKIFLYLNVYSISVLTLLETKHDKLYSL
ncbi:transmembrane protein [Pimephales promelas]|nr:transmembrane protein [Pimephales promelas]